LDRAFEGVSLDDDPFAQACFEGKCVTTNKQTKFSNDVVTWNEEQCMSVKQAHLFGDEANPIYFVAKEEDLGGYSQQYTQQQPWELPDSCKEQCEMTFSDMPIPPSVQDRGNKAKLSVKIQFKELAGVSSCPNCASSPHHDLLDCGPAPDTQQVVASTLGIGGKWGGFTYPNFFGEGNGDEVYAPVKAPTKRLKDAELTCVVEAQSILSSAHGLEGCSIFVISVMVAIGVSVML